MGDRTAFAMTIYDCPDPAEAAAILGIIEEYGLGLEWDTVTAPLDKLILCSAYTDHEMNCGSVDAYVGPAMLEAAPNASWSLHEDPKYDWLGATWKHTPDLGDFNAECDAQGQPVFGFIEFRGYLQRATDLQAALEGLPKHFGHAWDERFDVLAVANRGVEVTPTREGDDG